MRASRFWKVAGNPSSSATNFESHHSVASHSLLFPAIGRTLNRLALPGNAALAIILLPETHWKIQRITIGLHLQKFAFPTLDRYLRGNCCAKVARNTMNFPARNELGSELIRILSWPSATAGVLSADPWSPQQSRSSKLTA